MRKLDARQLAREKSLFRYSSALERADFGTVETILQEAERDPLLAKMITEINMVYESETFRLSPSLNHSSNHQKDLLMTTLVLPNQQRSMQRWLPITLAAACISMLFIGALMLRPIRPNNLQSGVQVQLTATPTAAATATLIPSPTPATGINAATALQPTAVPPDVQVNVQPAVASSNLTCNSKEAVILSPVNDSVVAGTVEIKGIATAPDFGSYKLELIGLGTGSQYLTVLDGSQPIASVGNLGQVNLSSFPPENYGLRLSVFDAALQVQGRCLVNITLARAAALPDVVVAENVYATAIPLTVLPIKAVVTTETYTRTSPAANATLGMTLTAGVVANIDQQSNDGQWSHVVLDGGKNGWVLSNVLQIETANVEAVAVPSSATGTRGFVSVDQTILRDQPDANAAMIRTIYHNTTVIVTETSADGQWVHITLPNGTQGWLYAKEVQTEGVPQTARPALLCWGIIGDQTAQVFSRPAISGSGVAILTLKPQTKVVIYDVDNQSGNASAWYFVQGATDEGLTVQGWVQDKDFAEHNTCSLPSSPPDQFTVVLPTLVPANAFAQATVITPDASGSTTAPLMATPTAYFDSVLRSNPPVIIITRPIGHIQANTQVQIEAAGFSGISGTNWNYQIRSANGTVELVSQDDLIAATTSNSAGSTSAVPLTMTAATPVPLAMVVPAEVQPAFSIAGSPVCITAIATDGTTMHVTNQLDKAATIYAAPLTNNSNASVVGELPAKGEAVLLSQQYDQQSAPIGALWYLIMTNDEGNKQVTGWISANSINASSSCAPEQLTEVTLTMAGVSSEQPNAAPAPSVAASGQSGRCTVVNQTDQPVPIYTSPLTADSNAAVVGEFPSQSEAVVISQNYDSQSEPNGALWYLIQTIGDKAVTGWISANAVYSWATCATEVANADISTAPVSQAGAGGVMASTVPDTAPLGICHVINPQRDSVPVYSGPSSKTDESTLVNNLTPNFPATVLYQQQNKQTGVVWYLVLAVMEQEKQISGWVSADSVKVLDRCPSLP